MKKTAPTKEERTCARCGKKTNRQDAVQSHLNDFCSRECYIAYNIDRIAQEWD